MNTKLNTTLGAPKTVVPEAREKSKSLEEQIHASNIALLRILDSQQETLEGDIELLESNTGRISLEEALDSAQSKESLLGSDEIRKFRGNLKSRVISAIKNLGLVESHIEGRKQQGVCNRKIVVDDVLITAVKENNL